jgi:eukaryotic-like serine/threonine-protein kinase
MSLEVDSIVAGRYRLIRRLAAGAMGAVYEAQHLGTDRRLALKVMLSHVIERPELRRRFELEARVSARVNSPFIVEVLDAGVDEATGVPFLVMELLRGEDIGQCLRRVGRFSPEETVGCLYQTALALEKTHAAGIVHRDLKPANLFLSVRDDGERCIKILDFGVAKLIATSADGRGATQTLGTPLYMAPEQFRGQQVSTATDIYALGMIAYTFLVGVAYWIDEKKQEDNLVAFALDAAYGPVELASVRAATKEVALSTAFDTWFAKATVVDPNKRFGSAIAAVRALADALGILNIDTLDLPQLAIRTEFSAAAKAQKVDNVVENVERPRQDADRTETGSLDGLPEIGPASENELPLAIREDGPAPAAEPLEYRPSASPVPIRRNRIRTKWFMLAGALLLATTGVAFFVIVLRNKPPPEAPIIVSPLQSPSSVVACPVFEASGVEAPAGWLGAAAAATVCERARVILGGSPQRTLVPAELLDLPRQPTDSFPADPYAAPDARNRSITAAQARAAAYIDGTVTKSASEFHVALAMHKPDGETLGQGMGNGRALYEAVRNAMAPLLETNQLPQAKEIDPVTVDWSRATTVDGALARLDVTLALAQNAGGLADECARFEQKSADLGELGPATKWLCEYTLGHPPPAAPLFPTDPAKTAEYVTRVRLNHRTARDKDAEIAAELQRIFNQDLPSLGRSVTAATASCLLESSDPKRAKEMALLAVQADPKNPLGELCQPWLQLMVMTRETSSAESTVRAMQTWVPWDSAGWYMQATSPGDSNDALAYARRAYTLSLFDTTMADILADLLLRRGAREEARNVAVAVSAGGHPVHRLESDLLMVRVDASEARIHAALERALRAMRVSDEDAGWVRVIRFDMAWRAVQLAAILGREREIADLVIKQFIDPEPTQLDGNDMSVPMRIPAICVLASKDAGRRCFERFRALRGRLSGGILPETDAFVAGAERYAAGDLEGAAKAWRPFLRQPGIFASTLPDAMATAFERTGNTELVDRLQARAAEEANQFGGASLMMVGAARRAEARGNRERAVTLAKKVIAAWSVADETVPAVEEMRGLLKRGR